MAEPNDTPGTPGEGEDVSDKPASLTQKDIHSAITERLGRHSKSIESMIEDKFTKLLETLKPAPKQDEPPPADGDEDKKIAARVKAAMAPLQKQLEEEKSARAKERETRLRDEERSSLLGALEQNGVTDPDFKKAAFAVLYHEDRRVARDAEGKLTFKVVDETTGLEEELPLAEGVKRWTQTDSAKKYLPPRPVAGSGASAGKPPVKRGNTKNERIALAEQMLADIVGKGLPST